MIGHPLGADNHMDGRDGTVMTAPRLSFEQAVQSIRREYEALGHDLGWRFLCVSKQVLALNPKIVFLTLNPGGRIVPLDHPAESCETGASYVVEQWGASRPGAHKLQRQVQELFAAIQRQVSPTDRSGVSIDESLVGYFVPFRSPRFADLHRPKESLAFAGNLWDSLLSPLTPRLLLAIDPKTFSHMDKICRTRGGKLISSESLPTGWGNVSADVIEYRFDDHSAMVVRLPHLSTFQLFSRRECEGYVHEILAKGCKYL